MPQHQLQQLFLTQYANRPEYWSILLHPRGFLIPQSGVLAVGIAGVPSKSKALLSTKWQAELDRAASPLLSFLKGMGAQQLCLRIVAAMAMPPPSAVEVLGDSFAGLVDKVRRVWVDWGAWATFEDVWRSCRTSNCR